MSFTALFYITVYGVGLVATFIHPIFGILTYIFDWHYAPAYQWWGDELPLGQDFRYSFVISVATLISALFHSRRLKKLPHMNFAPGIWLIFLVIWMYMVSYGWALVPAESQRKAFDFFKFVMFYFLLVFVVREYKHYRWVILSMMILATNLGRWAYERGKNRFLGFQLPNATEENAISAHIVSVLPFFGAKFLKENKWYKIFVILATPFLINLMILANSRGAFVSLLMVMFVGFLMSPLRDKLRITLAVIGGVALILVLANEQFWERQETIEEFKKEHSAASRLYLWRGAVKMMFDYPMGVGAEGPEQLSFKYVPELAYQMEKRGWGKTAHNTLLMAGTEWGWFGMLLFVGFITHTFLLLRRLKRKIKHIPHMYQEYYYEVFAVQLALVGLLTAGMFTNRFYVDALYWYAGFAVILHNIITSELQEAVEPVSPEELVTDELEPNGNDFEKVGKIDQIRPRRNNLG